MLGLAGPLLQDQHQALQAVLPAFCLRLVQVQYLERKIDSNFFNSHELKQITKILLLGSSCGARAPFRFLTISASSSILQFTTPHYRFYVSNCHREKDNQCTAFKPLDFQGTRCATAKSPEAGPRHRLPPGVILGRAIASCGARKSRARGAARLPSRQNTPPCSSPPVGTARLFHGSLWSTSSAPPEPQR